MAKRRAAARLELGDRAFTTWRRANGKQYLAVPSPHGDGVTIIRDDGAQFGAWHSVVNFRDAQDREGDTALILGHVRLSYNIID